MSGGVDSRKAAYLEAELQRLRSRVQHLSSVTSELAHRLGKVEQVVLHVTKSRAHVGTQLELPLHGSKGEQEELQSKGD